MHEKTPLQISSGACEQTYAIGHAAAVLGSCAPFPTECRVLRVYIAKITFTTLIDHFTSLDAESSLVLSDQLIKLELLTQSIRQQKLPPHTVRFAAFDPAVRMALAGVRDTAAVASCFGKTLYIVPIETLYCSKICPPCQSLFDKKSPLLQVFTGRAGECLCRTVYITAFQCRKRSSNKKRTCNFTEKSGSACVKYLSIFPESSLHNSKLFSTFVRLL